jgi:hypothetical protein
MRQTCNDVIYIYIYREREQYCSTHIEEAFPEHTTLMGKEGVGRPGAKEGRRRVRKKKSESQKKTLFSFSAF